ncbi:MAG: 4Fe-4S ferredoxin [Firmicutes bacterium]|nr:4Fe-4S ferredoxin [Bacillota bacterium]
MLKVDGVATKEDIEKVFPNKERLNKKAVAIIECFEKIPCNPCFTACKRKAIKEFKDINDLPKIDFEKCNGCGLCISKCPGLAIMVVDMTYSLDKALVKIPYEFLPLPKKGEVVKGLNRLGEYITDVEVINVLNSKGLDKTPIVSISIDKRYIKDIRNIRLKGE